MQVSKVLLSTTSVYPESTASAFELASSLGYDGVELMVGVDPLTMDEEAVAKLSEYHGVQVHSVHAPCLLVSQNTWGSDPWEKLERSARAAKRLGADVVVVHPPFRWQREYGEGFVDGIRRLNRESGVMFAVENMFPWRTPAGSFQAYLPDWDPTDLPYEHLTLDLSHASTSRLKSRDLVRAWGDRLAHIHLTDGGGSFKDEHLMPGEGDQEAWKLVEDLGTNGFGGHIVLEVSTRRARTRHERQEMLANALASTRAMLSKGVKG
ncbi:sugar phosphate isomerase/epimerase family protein [Tessaracoccus antarcticus]|uniref:sugar phosphate isomerase/epimerase family protein n=1 Tax=Tessaracoccus antarcticus TaxID=2479848 RepID=UPI001F20BDE8|nr:sugar phosphate isomerase/epimerase [Tessaracoccus antarcticus]